MDTKQIADLFKAVWDAFPDDDLARRRIYYAIEQEVERDS